ncbi:hypothetical protein TWF718_008807 [Orbilia javanica]|uniref:Uncharacterized protein n=1 Tax=Orbilia javanica TaxID=47235 RepID=A0AAN8MQW9_9PEZI
MASLVGQFPLSIPKVECLSKLRCIIDEKLSSVAFKLDEGSIDWKSKLKELLDGIYKLCSENWDLLRFILYTAGFALSIPIILQIAGFGLAGPVARSFAAAWQASIGNVEAGSFFAFLQSVGMAPATVTTTGALIEIGAFVWVELRKAGETPTSGDDAVPGGGTPLERAARSDIGRRVLDPLNSAYDAYQVVRHGFNSKRRWKL